MDTAHRAGTGQRAADLLGVAGDGGGRDGLRGLPGAAKPKKVGSRIGGAAVGPPRDL